MRELQREIDHVDVEISDPCSRSEIRSSWSVTCPESDRILTERCHELRVSFRERLITWALRYLIRVGDPR